MQRARPDVERKDGRYCERFPKTDSKGRLTSNMINLHPIIQQDIESIVQQNRSELRKLAGKKILITGASGMLASYLVYTFMRTNESLLKKPAQLYLVIRGRKKPFGIDKNIHHLNLDIAQKRPPVQHVQRVHYVIHAASKSAPKLYTKDLIDTLDTNIRGLYNLLDICDRHLKSFLYFSSGAVYGEETPDKPIRETYVGRVDHLNRRSCYVEGKRACETILMNYFLERGLPMKIARIFHTFGPGLNLNDGRVFSDFIKNGLEGANIEIRGDKYVKRPYLYIKDATNMFIKTLLSDKNGEVYNVASDKNVLSVAQLAKEVRNIFNIRYNERLKIVENKKKSRSYYKHVSRNYRADISKFKRDFEYAPKTDITTALERTIGYLTTDYKINNN